MLLLAPNNIHELLCRIFFTMYTIHRVQISQSQRAWLLFITIINNYNFIKYRLNTFFQEMATEYCSEKCMTNKTFCYSVNIWYHLRGKIDMNESWNLPLNALFSLSALPWSSCRGSMWRSSTPTSDRRAPQPQSPLRTCLITLHNTGEPSW